MVTGIHGDGDEVAPDTELTQLGHVDLKRSLNWSRINCSFRCAPSATDEGYISLQGGRLTVAEIVPIVARGDNAGTADCVRHTQAGDLLKAGFTVVWRPLKRQPNHVAVLVDADWDDAVAEDFDQCFTEFVKG